MGEALRGNNQCLRRASVPACPQPGETGVVGHEVAWVSRPAGVEGVAGQGQVSRWSTQRLNDLDTCP
jgi:hypothetical protein